MRQLKVLVVPIGPVSGGPWLERLLRELAEGLAMEIQLSRPIAYPGPAFNPARKKFFSHTIIDFLREIAGQVDFVLGLTEAELYSVHANSVWSEVHLGSRAGVIALSRLREFLVGERPEELLCQRLYKEMIRALGQMLGLRSCANPRCVMYPPRTLFELDLKGVALCPECRFRLRLRFGNLPLFREAA